MAGVAATVAWAPAALGGVDAAPKAGDRPTPRASASASITPQASRTRLLVRLRDDRGRAAVESRGGRLGRSIAGTRYRVVSVDGSASARGLAARLRGARGIADVRLDHRRRAAAPPDDALLAKGRQFSFGPLRLEEAWQHADGSGQTVAVLDTGADVDHPDLAGRLEPGRSFVATEPDVDDRNGHGTAVAGIVAAATGNGIGIAGVAPGAKVLPVKVLDEDGLGYDSEIAAGIGWAAEQGAGVINLSLAGSVPNPVLDEAIASARRQGTVVVAAAGNDGLPEPMYPAASPGVIAVTATDQGGEFAWFSSYGGWVDIAAPGWRMIAPVAIDGPREAYEVMVGTSFAAPVVSGTAALVRSQHPGWGVEEVEDRVLGTATDHGPDGVDDYYGHGFVDPAGAVGAPARPAARLADGDGNWSPDTARDAVYDGSGSIEQPGDVDWYKVTSDQAQTAHISVWGPNLESFTETYANDLDVAFDVYDAQLRRLDREDIWPENTTESGDVYLPAAGTYFIRVENMRGSRSPLLVRNPHAYSVSVEWRGADWSPPPVFMTPNQYEAPYPVAGEAMGAAVLDATGDGRADALITTEPPSAGNSHGGNVLLIAPQTTDGWLGSPVRMQMPADIGSRSAVGDIAGDGRQDLLISATGGWLLLEATGDGLAEPRALPETAGFRAIEVYDWDGDGRQDLVGTVGGAGGGVVALLRTDGGWKRTPLYAGNTWPIALGDLDGDGRTDAATVTFDAGGRGHATVLRRLPAGGVQAADAGPATGRVAVADVSGDGRDDLLTSHASADYLDYGFDVRRQLPGGTLSQPEWLGTFEPIDELVTGDVDGDGRTDVMTVSTMGLSTYRQRADGTLAPEQRESLPYASFYDWGGAAVGDITGDGTDDVVTANYNVGLVPSRGRSASWPPPAWVRASTPRDHARRIAADAAPTVTFTRALEPASISAQTVRLTDTSTGAEVAATREYAAATRTLTVRPAAPLVAGHAYRLSVTHVRDASGRIMNERGGRARYDEELGYPLLHDGPPELPFTTTFTVGTMPADTTPPDTLIAAGPQGVSDFATFVVASSEQGGRFECATDTSDWEPCSQETSGGGDGDGLETFRVRAVDTAGNRDPTPAQRSFELVPHAPGPPNFYPGNAVRIEGHTGTLEAQTVSHWDTPRWALSPINPGGEVGWYEWRAPADGTVAFDTSGSSFDTVMAVQSTGVPAPSQAGGPVVADDDDGGDGRAARITLDVREDVTYWIAVGGFFESFHDGAGWWGHAAAGDLELSWRFSPDGPAPDTQVTAGPPQHDRSATARFEFDATDVAATFACRLDGGAFTACASPHDVAGLADGEHVFEVRSSIAGVDDPTPAAYRWTVDTIAPVARIKSGPPAHTTERNAAFEIDSSEEGSSLRCRHDGGAWDGCTRWLGYDVSGLQTGPHTFELVATDLAGNVSETARWEWTVEPAPPPADSDPPATTLSKGPSGLVGSRTATFTFGADEDGTFECGLDGAGWTACTSPATYQGLADGQHAFRVRAVDLAGNADPAPLTREWTVDGTPPDTSITAGPPAETRDTSASIAFATTEPATVSCSVDGGEWKVCASPLRLDDVAPGAHRVEVAGVDAVGNADRTPAVHRWTVLGAESEAGPDGGAPGGGAPGRGDPSPAPGSDPPPPADDALPVKLGLPTWLRGWLQDRTARGLRRSGRAIPVRVTACPDLGDSRFAGTAACRFAARARLTLLARGAKIATAARRVEPGRIATLRTRLTRRGLALVRRPGAMRVRAVLTIVTADGAVTRVVWRPRVR